MEECVFNFFNEIKGKFSQEDFLNNFNLVNLSGKMLYVEGHLGVTTLTTETITFKVKGGRVVVEGENLRLIELTQNTIIIEGNIKRTEIF